MTPEPNRPDEREAAEVLAALVAACEAEFCGPGTEEHEPDDAKVAFPEDRCHITFGHIRRARKALASLRRDAPREGASVPKHPVPQDWIDAGGMIALICDTPYGPGISFNCDEAATVFTDFFREPILPRPDGADQDDHICDAECQRALDKFFDSLPEPERSSGSPDRGADAAICSAVAPDGQAHGALAPDRAPREGGEADPYQSRGFYSDEVVSAPSDAPERDAVGELAGKPQVSTTYGMRGGETIPQVLVIYEFPPEDWKARDAFAAALRAPEQPS